MFRRCLLVVLTLAGATPALAAPVVALGASNTEGRGRGATPDGVPRSQAYPAQLEKLLASQGCRVRVANAGIAGDSTAGMLRRLPGAIGKDTRVLILQAGGNDARRGEGASTAANVAAIEAYARDRGITVVTLDQLGRIAPGERLADGQHFSAAGHAAFAAYLAPRVRSAACGG